MRVVSRCLQGQALVGLTFRDAEDSIRGWSCARQRLVFLLLLLCVILAVCHCCTCIVTLTSGVLQDMKRRLNLTGIPSLLSTLTADLNLRLVVRLAHAMLPRLVVLLVRRQGRHLRRLFHADQVIFDQ